MSIQLNHIIVPAKDKWASAEFLAGILGLRAGPQWAHFVPVVVSNGVTLDYCDDKAPTHPNAPGGALCNGGVDQCDGNGACIDCFDNGGCDESSVCTNNVCVPA